MTVRFLGAESDSGVGTEIDITIPALASLRRGDLLFSFVAIQGYVGTSLTPPSGWSVEPSHHTAGDLIVFSLLHYVGNEAEEEQVAGIYSSSKSWVVLTGAYRGVKEDVLDDPVNYPFGYYAPSGSVNGARTQTAVTSISTPLTGTSSLVPWARSVFLLAGSHASLKPQLSDVSPFVAMRAKVETNKVSAMLCDVRWPAAVATLPSYSSAASLTLSGSIGAMRTLEPIVAANDSLDTYKAKIMRKMLPPPYRKDFDGEIGKLITIIGGGDNEIGGLVGSADFLPDEVP